MEIPRTTNENGKEPHDKSNEKENKKGKEEVVGPPGRESSTLRPRTREIRVPKHMLDYYW